MKFFRNISIQKKLSLIALLTCVTALGLTSVALMLNEMRSFRRNLVVDVGGQARMLAGLSTAALAFDDKATAAELLTELKDQQHIDQATIYQAGQVFSRYQRSEEFTNVVGWEHSEPEGNAYEFRHGFLILHREVLVREKSVGSICIVANTHALTLRLVQYGIILLVVFVVATALALSLASRLQLTISSPVLALATTAKVVAEEKDYSVRAKSYGNDEIGQLTSAFNLMLSRIQSQDAALNVSQAKLEALINSIDGIVWEWNPQNSQFTFVSRQCERILGYPVQQWLDDSNFRERIIHPEDLDAVNQTCHLAAERREPFSQQFRMVAADQRLMWMQASGIMQLDSSGAMIFRGIFIDITAQKLAAQELAKLNEQIALAQRQAGMAEVATGVLHNVGNVLNSVNVSAHLVRDGISKSQIQNLVKATNLLRDHAGDAANFFSHDPKGQKLPAFLIKLGDHIATEQRTWQQELESLGKNIEHIKEIVSMQQSYARLGGITEALNAADLVEDSLRMNEAALARHQIKVVRQFDPVAKVMVDKHKVLQILINLIRNAKYAMDAASPGVKTLTVRIASTDAGRVQVSVSDNGIGIAPENLRKIFQHGFTTKKDGHGFGLHSGANAAREMGGSLLVQSDGPGSGATFVLELPTTRTQPAVPNQAEL